MSLDKHFSPKAQPPPAPPADTFEHARHRSLACLTCHAVQGSARLTFEAPRGCQICHHQAPSESRCATCHETQELAAPHAELLSVAVRGQPRRSRTVSFSHAAHPRTPCASCHTERVSMEVADSARTCAACHDDHHQAARACAACHNEPAALAPHAPPAEAHDGCDACHAARTVERLTPDRAFCLACHAPQRNHEPALECTTCHFLADPTAYRRHLIRS